MVDDIARERAIYQALVLRGGGTALASACRTVRRCTRYLSASSRIEQPSTRASRLIAANNSTLDPNPPALP